MAKQHSPAFLAMVETARSQIREVSIEDAVRLSRTEAAILVDVREDREFSRTGCLGAVHIGKGVIERDIEKRFPDKSTPLILYCGGGFRSALAALSLVQMGYRSVWSMAGGIRAWSQAGYPLRDDDHKP